MIPLAEQATRAAEAGRQNLIKLSPMAPPDPYRAASVVLARNWLGKGRSADPHSSTQRIHQLGFWQRSDGSWAGDPSTTALAIGAFLVSGSTPDDPLVAKAIVWLQEPERLRNIGPCARQLLFLNGLTQGEQKPQIGLAALAANHSTESFCQSILWHLTAMELLSIQGIPLPGKITSIFDRLPNPPALTVAPTMMDKIKFKVMGGEAGLRKRAEEFLVSGAEMHWSRTVIPTLALLATGKIEQSEASRQLEKAPWRMLACVDRDVDLAVGNPLRETRLLLGDSSIRSQEQSNPLSREVPLDRLSPEILGRSLAAGDTNPENVKQLIDLQNSDATWNGRTGLGFLSGTCWALRGLKAAGQDDREAYILRAGEWFRAMQNADGGWGESIESFSKGYYVQAESTPCQTGWAVLGLLAGGDTASMSVDKGVEFLLAKQRADGHWEQEVETCVGFPGGMLWNDSQQVNAVCVLALSEFARLRGKR